MRVLRRQVRGPAPALSVAVIVVLCLSLISGGPGSTSASAAPPRAAAVYVDCGGGGCSDRCPVSVAHLGRARQHRSIGSAAGGYDRLRRLRGGGGGRRWSQ